MVEGRKLLESQGLISSSEELKHRLLVTALCKAVNFSILPAVMSAFAERLFKVPRISTKKQGNNEGRYSADYCPMKQVLHPGHRASCTLKEEDGMYIAYRNLILVISSSR